MSLSSIVYRRVVRVGSAASEQLAAAQGALDARVAQRAGGPLTLLCHQAVAQAAYIEAHSSLLCSWGSQCVDHRPVAGIPNDDRHQLQLRMQEQRVRAEHNQHKGADCSAPHVRPLTLPSAPQQLIRLESDCLGAPSRCVRWVRSFASTVRVPRTPRATSLPSCSNLERRYDDLGGYVAQ